MRVVLIVLLLVAVLSADYCETMVDETNFYVTPDETRILKLNSYIRGYDLDFQVDDASSAKLYNSFATADKKDLALKDYKAFKSADVRKSPKANGMGFGALLAQKEDDTGIAVWMGKFEGYNKLPDLTNWKFLDLPQGLVANCFDLKVADDEGKWGALNCQTVPQSQEETVQDLLCWISQDDTSLSLKTNCKLFSTPFSTRARKSAILKLSGRTYLLSANTDLVDQKVSVSYIAIYYFSSNNQFVFGNIIDGSYLDNPEMEISDFDIGSDNSIIVADSLGSRLIFFTYSLQNIVSVSKVVNYQGRPLAISYNSDADSLLVATKDIINEHNYQSLGNIINKYEVDSSDCLIVDIQASKNLVSFTTRNKNLYIYERNQHKINYLLTKIEINTETFFILSQQNSYIFSFSQLIAQSSYVSQPYLQISKVDADKNVKVTAKSETATCVLQLNLKSVKNGDDIINKMPLEGKTFKVDSVSGLSLQLDNYFGGANLEYNIPQQTRMNKDFSFDIKHLNQYTFTPTFAKTEVSTILHLTPTSFYYIGINSIQQSKVYVDACKLDNVQITCQSFLVLRTLQTKKTIQSITSYRRSNGMSVVLWSYKYSGIAEWIYIQKHGIGQTTHGYPLAYSSLHIDQEYFIAVSKTGRYISILFEEQPFYAGISQDLFTAQQLVEVEYFYPREVYIDRTNSKIFYVKLPTKIAKFHILDNHEVEYVGIVKSFGEYKLDSQWSINFDRNNIITHRDNQITEEYYNYVDMKYVKTNSILYTVDSKPIQYDPITGNSYIVSSGNPDGQRWVKIMKPFNGVVDAQYSQISVKGDVFISGNWLLTDSDTPSVYFIDSHPILSITSDIPEDTFKQDVNFTLEVKSKSQSEKTVTEIQGVNYPVGIKNLPNSTIVTLPFSAASVQIKLPVDKYFSGPISYYSLSCPLCGGSHIHLYGPLVTNKSIDTLPAIVDFIKYDDKVIALSFNTLNLMNSKLEVIKTVEIPKTTCTNLQYNPQISIQLLVFCTSETGEQILKYGILNNDFILVDTYIFLAEDRIRYLDEMFAVRKQDKNFLFILDNDETVDSNKKQSTIKMYDFTDNFTYEGEWTSKTFGLDQYYPINDLEIIDSSVFVTIGNYGIGYGTLDDNGNLVDVGSLQLSTVPQIKDSLLEDSFFKQIEVLSNKDTPSEVKVFLTTTNALSMVINLGLDNKIYTFKTLKESYYRYGNERLLNWHAVTKDSIYLSYYNEQFETVNLVYYKRAQNVRTHFSDGALIRVSKNQIKYHEAILVGKKLITSHLSDVPSEGQLTLYDTYNDFVLWIDYEQGGAFDSIQIQAFNDYKQSSHIQPIKFQKPIPPPGPDSDGVKWYIILIVALVVLIAVGVAYGLFIYMKKKRAEKSVSLLTEKEQDGEEEDHKDTFNESETRAGELNRTSINATD